MGIIVQKFGGSSVADTEKIRKIASLVAAVKNAGHDVAVVVSAMGKTTNHLAELAQSIASDPSGREMDMLLSTGERITMSLLCMALNEIGIEAVSLTGSQAGIITNDRHNDARVIEVRPFRVQDEIAAGKVVVIGGFQGVSYKRDVTTLGRGGSDTSAVALAAALDAERCEIYSDIDGVYTSDPGIVKDALHIPEISYQLMQEMSQAGAKVLNAQAVQFAKEANIAIYARSTFSPGRETVVRKMAPGLVSGVKAVVHENDVVRVSLISDTESMQNIASYLAKKNINAKEMHFRRDGRLTDCSFVLSVKNLYNADSVIKDLNDRFKGGINFENELGAVSLIGDGINDNAGILPETLKMLADEGISVLGVTTTSFRISLLTDKDCLEKCTRLCHDKWIKPA